MRSVIVRGTAVLGAAVVGAGVVAGPAGANAAPETSMVTPVQNVVVGLGQLPLGGGATDDVGVAAVRWSVRDIVRGLWLQPDGTWGAARKDFTASVASPGARSTTWSATWTPPAAGEFAVGAAAVDGTGAVDRSRVWRSVSVRGPRLGGGYLTLQFGRSMWVPTDSRCNPIPEAVTLGTVADAMRQRGLTGTSAVVINRTAESSRLCFKNYILQASWDDLARLRDEYGWTMVSNGTTHDDITLMTPEQQREESCGSLQALAAHGHTRAWGLFAYGNDKSTTELQRDLVATCFAYGRKYYRNYPAGSGLGSGVNQRSLVTSPWFLGVNSVSGGNCNDQALPCFSLATAGSQRYWLPERMASILAPGPGEWSVVQMYRFVDGFVPGRWDCTSPDPRQHWTSVAEFYCYRDFLAALDTIPTDVTVTDPATVATAWGRIP